MSESQTTTIDWSTSLIELLQQQYSLVGELTHLAEMQGRFIEESNTDGLLGLLTQRQQIIDRFSGIQTDLSGRTENLESRLKTVDEPTRMRIQTLIGDIGDRLTQVMHRDEKDQNALEDARKKTGNELNSLGAARQARNAYLAGKTVNNRFADHRG